MVAKTISGNVTPKAKTLSNQQKHFVKVFQTYVSNYNSWNRTNVAVDLPNLKNDIWYLSRTFDVKFFKCMSWQSPRVIINDYDFGRFNVYMKTYHNICGIYTKSPRHKHPHAFSDNAVKNKPVRTCLGSSMMSCFLSGHLWQCYKIGNSVINNVSSDIHTTSRFYHPDVNLLYDFCYDFFDKKHEKCHDCGTGYIHDERCTYYDCDNCPYRADLSLKEDDEFDEY